MATQKKEMTSIIYIAAMLVFGILFCLSFSLGITAVSWVVGVLLIIMAIVLLIESYSETRSLISMKGILSAVIGAIGVLCIVNRLAGVIVAYFPYILIFIGIYIIIDSIIFLSSKKKGGYALFVIELVIGIVALTLGILLLTVPEVYQYASIIFGSILIIVGIFELLLLLKKRKAPQR